jgi:methylglyoxal synthase
LKLPLPSDAVQSAGPIRGPRSPGTPVEQQQFTTLTFLQDPLLALLLAIALPPPH